jgi:hypothetical protein
VCVCVAAVFLQSPYRHSKSFYERFLSCDASLTFDKRERRKKKKKNRKR